MAGRIDPRVRKIQQGKAGRSYYITLPIDIIRKLKWQEHQKVRVVFNEKRKTILIKDWKK